MTQARPLPANIFSGVAGWSIPAALGEAFASGGSHLERYASRFNAVEINSSFYRPHRRTTYERWAASVPGDFRFAVKMPKAITHDRRLRDYRPLLDRFAGEVAGLGGKRGPVLVQLPPSLDFDLATAAYFFADARRVLSGAIVCEPRHASWFGADADAILMQEQVARVVADPLLSPGGSLPGGWPGLVYFRLHGAPRLYWSDYSEARIVAQARLAQDHAQAGRQVWTIFDNTAQGHAPANALALTDRLS